MNPLTSLYQTAIGALVDVMSPKARKYAYAVAAVVLLLVGIWQASGGDWKAALLLLASLGFTMAHANTNSADPQAFTPAAGGAQPADPTPEQQ